MNILFHNIKDLSAVIELKPVAVITGKNGSGKSAALEAIRLAATGCCTLGSAARSVAKIATSPASSTIITPEGEARWHLINTTVIHENDMQGDMPVDVATFWSLSAERRMRLLACADLLEANDTAAAEAKQAIEALSPIIKSSPPPTPAPYEGPPLHSFREELDDLTLKLAAHRTKGTLSNRKELEKRLAWLKKDLEDMLQKNRGVSDVPPLVRRLPGVMDDILEMCHWCSMEDERWLDAIDVLSGLPIPSHIPEDIVEDVKLRGLAIEKAQRELDTYVVRPDEYEDWVMRHAELVRLEGLARGWESFGEATGQWSVKRQEAIRREAELQHQIDMLREERRGLIGDVKHDIEKAANDMLAMANLSPLKINIEGTKKTTRLLVTVDGLPIESLAASEKLLYGLCLLSAIHDASSATHPILVAECAEMDGDTMSSAVKCLSTRKKGSVVLEHWSASGIDPSIVWLF